MEKSSFDTLQNISFCVLLKSAEVAMISICKAFVQNTENSFHFMVGNCDASFTITISLYDSDIKQLNLRCFMAACCFEGRLEMSKRQFDHKSNT